MRCPSCRRPVDHEAESCYSCGYSAEVSMSQFGYNDVRMKRVHDGADCLRVKEIWDIEDLFRQLDSRFPQLLFAVYLGDLPDSMSPGELGFWLLNRARIEGTELQQSNDCAILLIIDMENKQAGLSLGYFAERLLTEHDCIRTLMNSRPLLINGDFGDAVVRIFRKLDRILTARSKKLKGMNREQWQSDFIAREELNVLSLPGPLFPGYRDLHQKGRKETKKEIELAQR